MSEGYCDKCKAKREIAEGVEEVTKNGRRSVKGKCPVCGQDMFKILTPTETSDTSFKHSAE